MARDYKNSSSTRKSGGSSNGRPMLTGIIIGLILGLGISVGVAVYLKGAPSPFVDVSKRHDDQGQAASAAQASAPQADKPKFDFYTILPGSEETLDEKASPNKDASATAAAASSKNTYFLQAGAYQDESQADNLKAKLALLGVEAIIQTAQVGDKGTWHRVRIGPYKSLDDLSQVRANLQQQGIETSIIKVSEAKP